MDPHTLSCTGYHLRTSYERGQLGGHYLDWGNQPSVYKDYPDRPPVLLPDAGSLPENGLWDILGEQAPAPGPTPVDSALLSGILRLAYSLTARARHPTGEIFFRSVASAGALYPGEIYLASPGLPDLESGVYHFSIRDHGLTPLRRENPCAAVDKALAGVSFLSPGLTFFLTALFFRSAWKYRERSYRYHLLDTGHLLENLVLALTAQGLRPSVFPDFDDVRVNRLLGLDPQKEVCLTLCTLPAGTGDRKPGGAHPEPGEAVIPASRMAAAEKTSPLVEQMHRAAHAMPPAPEPVPAMSERLGLPSGQWTPVDPPHPWPRTLGYAEAVMRRRSKRNFIPEAISKSALHALLHGLCGQCTADPGHRGQAMSTGFLIGHAQGVDPGLYLLDPVSAGQRPVRPGRFTQPMAHICLNQMWLAHAAVHFLFMANLTVLDETWGPRGYRYAMSRAGRLGQRLYLMATALGLGCCGIGALYDSEAARLLGLNPESRLLYLVAVGPVKDARPQG